jgi:hypothetical protein
MSPLRRFLLKVNASNCPGEIGRPDNVADWEGKIFKADTPRKTQERVHLPPEQTRNPDPGDHLLIWINDGPTGKGAGLTAIGEVSTFHPDTHEMVIKSIALFPDPRLNGTDLRDPNHHPALNDLHDSRVVPLRYIDHERWDAIREVAAIKVTNAARVYQNVTTAVEGKRLYIEATKLGRDSEFPKLVKELNRQQHSGVYKCEACCFSANKSSLFDAHHLVPLRLGERRTRSALEFAVLCPTCHRLAHRLAGALYDPLPVLEIKRWWQDREK